MPCPASARRPCLKTAAICAADLVTRTAYAEIPPRVVYELTPAGQRLRTVLDSMHQWAEQDLPRSVTPSDAGTGQSW
jgi:DNA-binding HxlR family transcriptional regulator